MTFGEKVALGRTGLRVGRMGVASGYWAPATAIEEAFERGCNYFTWGTFIKGYSPHMREALRNIAGKGQRDRLVLAMFSYAHYPFLTEHFLVKGLKSAGLDHADALILGYFPKPPSERIIEGALKLKQKGLIRFIGLSGHNRLLFPEIRDNITFDICHLRYSAVHRGAETEVFPFLPYEDRAGVVSFMATAWGKLLNPERMPPGETPPTAAECYRFVLTNSAVDVCMTGARTLDEMRHNLEVLEQGPMDNYELARMRRVGDHLHRQRLHWLG